MGGGGGGSTSRRLGQQIWGTGTDAKTNQRKTIERQFEPGTFATSHSHYAIEDDHIIS